MTNKLILAAAALSLLSATALAQSQSQSYADAARSGAITSGAGDQGPGGLTSSQVVGKRLLDAEGNPLGMIEKVTADGQSAVVRNGSSRTSVDMKYLSLGTGAHTVIKQNYSQADVLNGQNAASLAAEEKARRESTTTTYSGSSQPVVILPSTSTSVTTTREIHN